MSKKNKDMSNNKSNNDFRMMSEKAYIEALVNAIPENDLKEHDNYALRKRLENLLTWYRKKSESSKRIYYICAVFAIAVNTAIPVITMFDITNLKYFIAIISAISAFLLAISNLFSFQDRWKRNRKFCEMVKSECFLYIMKNGVYEDELTALDEFVKRIEYINYSENKEWFELNKRENKQENSISDKSETKGS